ncbi:N-myc-interactor isoform X2 [Eublepharis macularius]|uniref:N-myc-interactor isoform X2 n=1 Tax=Eublepharis macularius TaxID=481883 RepID=A0AA97IYA3_EUBMA|nr:N-myc-interactor isoform X2 [Eublepharis macularius]
MLKAEGEIPGMQENESGNIQDLEKWKEKTAKAENQKAKLLLAKLTADEERRKWELELKRLKDVEDKLAKERKLDWENYQKNLSIINEQKNELRREIQFLKDKITAKKAKCEELAQRFRLKRFIPETKVKFTHLEKVKNEEMHTNICCFFDVSTNISFKLNKGEALITFEEENVTQELLQKSHHVVNLENAKTAVRVRPVELESGLSFWLNVKISRKKINVSDIPNLPIPDEWVKDKLELNFCKTKPGGGDVQDVLYDRQSQMAIITFVQPGVANNIVKWAEYPFRASDEIYVVMVSPIVEKYLERFEMFSGISKRTLLLTDIQDKAEDEESMQDMIAIHFQKPSNGGGEVEYIRYVSKGTNVAYFEMDTESGI